MIRLLLDIGVYQIVCVKSKLSSNAVLFVRTFCMWCCHLRHRVNSKTQGLLFTYTLYLIKGKTANMLFCRIFFQDDSIVSNTPPVA